MAAVNGTRFVLCMCRVAETQGDVWCRGAAAAQQLGQVLDGMHAMKARLGDRYELCGPAHRSTGSHGVVEIAQLPGSSVCRHPEPCRR